MRDIPELSSIFQQAVALSPLPDCHMKINLEDDLLLTCSNSLSVPSSLTNFPNWIRPAFTFSRNFVSGGPENWFLLQFSLLLFDRTCMTQNWLTFIPNAFGRDRQIWPHMQLSFVSFSDSSVATKMQSKEMLMIQKFWMKPPTNHRVSIDCATWFLLKISKLWLKTI